MPTHREYPWLRDLRSRLTAADPEDPARAAQVHEAKQLAAIDDARQATSEPPPQAS